MDIEEPYKRITSKNIKLHKKKIHIKKHNQKKFSNKVWKTHQYKILSTRQQKRARARVMAALCNKVSDFNTEYYDSIEERDDDKDNSDDFWLRFAWLWQPFED